MGKCLKAQTTKAVVKMTVKASKTYQHCTNNFNLYKKVVLSKYLHIQHGECPKYNI